jgi:L-proline amide hydrolase
LPEKAGDESFWTEEQFLDKLSNLISHLKLKKYDILGSLWGGMLGSRFASRRPKGLRKLVLTNSSADMKLRYKAIDQYRLEFPKDVQAVLKEHEDARPTNSKEYNNACGVFFQQHICRLSFPPPEFLKAGKEASKDRTVALVMSGPHRFRNTGTLKNWSMIGEASKIEVPTLLINGERDTASDESVGPFWREIPTVKWVKFAHSGSGTHLEERKMFTKVVGEFLCDE